MTQKQCNKKMNAKNAMTHTVDSFSFGISINLMQVLKI